MSPASLRLFGHLRGSTITHQPLSVSCGADQAPWGAHILHILKSSSPTKSPQSFIMGLSYAHLIGPLRCF